jgi:hypothetical protein
MSVPVTLTAGSLPGGFCPTTYQAQLEAFVAAMSASITGDNNSFNYGSAEPASENRGRPWIEIDVNGHIVSISNWNTALGIWDPYDGRPYFGTTTNVGNDYTLAINDRSIVSDASGHGLFFLAEFNSANTGAATMTIDSPTAFNLGPYPLNKNFNQALVAGDISATQLVLFAFNDTRNVFEVLSVLPLPAGTTKKIAVLQDQKADGTDGGTFTTGAWQTRTINTLVSDPTGIITSLASNQIELATGTYTIRAECAACVQVDRHRMRIQNVTDATTIIQGPNSDANSGAGANGEAGAYVEGRVTVASGTKKFEIQHRCQTTRATDGFGADCTFGTTEVYLQVIVEKD